MDPSKTSSVGLSEPGTMPGLSDAESHKILVEWNNTASDYPADKCVHELVELQASRSPYAIAVVDG